MFGYLEFAQIVWIIKGVLLCQSFNMGVNGGQINGVVMLHKPKVKKIHSFITFLQTQDFLVLSGVKYTRDLEIFLTYPKIV